MSYASIYATTSFTNRHSSLSESTAKIKKPFNPIDNIARPQSSLHKETNYLADKIGQNYKNSPYRNEKTNYQFDRCVDRPCLKEEKVVYGRQKALHQPQERSNDQKIAEIKRKYEKLMIQQGQSSQSRKNTGSQSSNKKDYQYFGSRDYDNSSRLVTDFNVQRDNYIPNCDRKECPEDQIAWKKSFRIDLSAGKNTDLKKQLDNNRCQLSSLKAQLKTKLTDLSLRSNNNSLKPSLYEQCKAEGGVETVLSKYAKYGKQMGKDTDRERGEKLLEELRRGRQNSKFQQKNLHQKKDQLSRITEVSNSNNSETILNDIDDKHTFKNTYQQNAYSKIEYVCRQKEGDNTWFRNATSFLDERGTNEPKKQQLSIDKLDNVKGVNIKRTTTEENFMNMHKVSFHEQKIEKSVSYINDSVHRDILERQRQREKEMRLMSERMKEKQNEAKKKIDLELQRQIDDKKQNQFYKENEKIFMKESENPKHLTKELEYKSMRNECHHDYQQLKDKQSKQLFNKERQNQVKPRDDTKNTSQGSLSYKQPIDPIDGERQSNQKLAKEIQRIDRKIKEFEQNKRDLTISYKNQEADQRTKIIDPKVDLSQKSHSRTLSFLEKVKPMYSQKTITEHQLQPSSFAIKLIPCDTTEQGRYYISRSEIDVRTNSGIQERRRKLQDKVIGHQNQKDHLKRLVKVFCDQAALDEQFRNNKIWFSSYLNHLKWQELKRELRLRQISVNDQALKDEFSVTQTQHNPFFSLNDYKCDISSLVESYGKSRQHWQQNLKGQFKRQSLEREGLSAAKMDLDKKGYMLVEDLVRFLNIESGTFLRNRDLSIIFKRLGKQKLTFEELIAFLVGPK